MPTLSPWQRDDGFPSNAYFDAVEAALTRAGVPIADACRDEPWEYTVELWDHENPREHGPMNWADHGLYISWRTDEDDEARHADDFTGIGWYWVPYTKPGALGDYAQPFNLPYLAEPEDVAHVTSRLLAGE